MADKPEVGNGRGAFPAADRVGFALPQPLGAAGGARVGYGFTEAVLGLDDTHHRFDGALAASVTPLDWLSLGVELGGRYDLHDVPGQEPDQGFAGYSSLTGRAVRSIDRGLWLGGELSVRLPGAPNFANGVASTSVDGRVLLSFAPADGRLALASMLGYRIDRAKNGADDAQALSPADRVGLGGSDWNSLLLGLAASYRLDPLDLLLEWTWDVQVGDGAPPALQSPFRVSAIGRHWLSDRAHVQLLLGASPSQQPKVLNAGPLQVVEPRLWLEVGLGLYFPTVEPPPEVVEPEVHTPPPPVVAHGTLRGVVQGPDGQAAAGVEITLQPAAADATPASTSTGPDGRFELTGVPPGKGTLAARGSGFADYEVEVEIAEGGTLAQDIALSPALPEAVIRGTVRAFNGRSLAAQIRIEPLGLQARSEADGSFEVEVPPGDYTVVVSAPGYETQERPAKVEEQGVTVIIVDLRRSR